MQLNIYPEILEALKKTEQDSLSWNIDQASIINQTKRILFLNAHGVNLTSCNGNFLKELLASDYLLRDGIGLELGFKYLNLKKTENLNGTDLIPKILHANKDKKIAVWGSSDEALRKLRARLKDEGYHNLAPMQHGFHLDEFYLEEYNSVKPDILILCMGMPRQEILSGKLAKLEHSSLIICGGGWADFYSGHKKRAPEWVRKIKMEWVHRLCSEPFRLGKRYTIDLAHYFFIIYKITHCKKEKTL
ncbi:MAG: WecB/TagA/CpsF family glycosyltransferase [Alphaproteobacteria bacterium]|nr:WecB/TagA/CpsF family glycosyltransferase [Alphaproteobacteria bacterium]